MKIKRIAIFASGNGTNAECIINHFNQIDNVQVSLILSNKPDAYVLTRAKTHYINNVTFTRDDFYKSVKVTDLLKKEQIDFVVLAGFLWLIPDHMIAAYPQKIINIHPALLPKYGGKGMYGDRVHEAVKMAGDKESGITIHWVNEKYDDGQVIFQAKCEILTDDTPEAIAQKVHTLEYQHYPVVIESVLEKLD